METQPQRGGMLVESKYTPTYQKPQRGEIILNGLGFLAVVRFETVLRMGRIRINDCNLVF